MKILLLRPNSGIPVAPPPIGLMYLAGYLRQYRPGKDQITIMDGRSELYSEDQIAQAVHDLQPDLAGITAFTMEGESAHRYARLVKEHASGCVTIIGGPYGTSDSATALADSSVDFTARGEGELTLFNLVERLEKGESVADLNGLAHRHNGQIVAGAFP